MYLYCPWEARWPGIAAVYGKVVSQRWSVCMGTVAMPVDFAAWIWWIVAGRKEPWLSNLAPALLFAWLGPVCIVTVVRYRRERKGATP